MGRHLLAVAVVLVEAVLLTYAHPNAAAVCAVLACALVVALSYRAPAPAFAVAAALAAATGGAYVLLLWTAYQAGRRVSSRWDVTVVAAAAIGGLGAQVMARPVEPRMIPNLVCAYVVFVALPLLVGRYLAQHRRLVTTLDAHNRRLRQERALLAEQERLRERLRIARDMHDSLGRWLSLVSVQAAALEVTVPPGEREAVRRLAATARGATDELHEMLGTLRQDPPCVETVGEVVEQFRRAGMPVTLCRRGEARPVPADAGDAAYHVVEEGLTNAAKHAPGQPVTVTLEWEPDALLVTVVNPHHPSYEGDAPGHGLRGLSERAAAAGGFSGHRADDEGFRLFALLPLTAEDRDPPAARGARTAVLGFVTATLMFVCLPAAMLLGAA